MLAIIAVVAQLAGGSDFDWRPHHSALEAAALATLALDMSQTHAIQLEGSEEANPILGLHPSRARVNLYFAGVALAHVLAARVLPSPFREVFQGGTILLEIGVIRYNRGLGVGFAVPW